MARVTDTVLKTYFETDDQPTTKQFENLIDSKRLYVEEQEVTIFVDSSLGVIKIPMIVPDRNITVTYFAMFSPDASADVDHQLYKNSGGTLTALTASTDSVLDFDTGSSFPTETITTSSVSAGDCIYVDVTAVTAGDNFTFVLRYY